MKKSRIIIATLFTVFGLLGATKARAVTSDFFVTSGTDATATSSATFTATDISRLSASDSPGVLHFVTNASWPMTGSYDENRYVEFIFSPNVPADATINSVSVTNEFQRHAVLDGAKLEIWDGLSFFDHNLTLPTNGDDLSETVYVSSEINTPSKVNSLKIRFVAFRNPPTVSDNKTGHDFIKVTVDYTPAPPPPPPPLMHNIVATAGGGGSITPSGTIVVDDGADQSFTVTADPGFNVADVLVDGSSVGVVPTYTFSAVSSDHNIMATFTPVLVPPPPPDTTPPVITLLGDSTVEIDQGATYLDAGATALDDTDSDISGNILTAGLPVDTSVLGPHVITYNVSDSAGNAAMEVTRTVNVNEVTVLPSLPTEPEPVVSQSSGGGSGRVFFLPESAPSFGLVGEIGAGSGEGQVLGEVTFRFDTNLHRGSRFLPDVLELQKRLTVELYYFGPLTGYFGPYTVVILGDYQQAHGLPITGALDEATRNELNSGRIVANPKVVQKLLGLTI